MAPHRAHLTPAPMLLRFLSACFSAVCLVVSVSNPVYGQLVAPTIDYALLEEVTIIGSAADVRLLTGTGGAKALCRRKHVDLGPLQAL